MNILVTGGAGFIGSALIRFILEHTSHSVCCVDKLTYAGNMSSLLSVLDHERFAFFHADICNAASMADIIGTTKPHIIMHLAAESHVDRSIDAPDDFMQTNILGTYTLLQLSLKYWQELPSTRKNTFRFLHVSTDEVFGDLGNTKAMFTEQSSYNPSSPYSASKASSDHLVRAWHRTYNFPVLISNCSNNYGPYQFPEKLIPKLIHNALAGLPLSIYGSGEQIRDWLYVDDHARALLAIVEKGSLGDTYCIGGHNEKTNLEVVHRICDILNEQYPAQGKNISDYKTLIRFVADRPGHDQRYAIDASHIQQTLGWYPQESFESGLEKTVRWYLENQSWVQDIISGDYRKINTAMCKKKRVIS